MSQPTPFRERIEVLKPLAVRDFALLWTGMTVSMIGDGIYYVSIAWQVLDLENRPGPRSRSSAWRGRCPQVLLVLASGAFSDRDRAAAPDDRGDAIRFVAIGTLGVLSIADALTIPLILMLVAIYGSGMALSARLHVDRAVDRPGGHARAGQLARAVHATVRDVPRRARWSAGC